FIEAPVAFCLPASAVKLVALDSLRPDAANYLNPCAEVFHPRPNILLGRLGLDCLASRSRRRVFAFHGVDIRELRPCRLLPVLRRDLLRRQCTTPCLSTYRS